MDSVSEMKALVTAWMKESGATDVAPNPAYDASRPLFNSRDEALKHDVKGTGRERSKKS